MQHSAHTNFLLYFNYCFIVIKIFYFVRAHVYVLYLHVHHIKPVFHLNPDAIEIISSSFIKC